MSLLIRSTSFLMQKTQYWDSLKKFKVDFAEYGNIFNFHNSKKEFDYEISVIFLQDIINFYCNEKKEISLEKKKINKLLKVINNKVKIKKKVNHVFFISGYYYSNLISTLKYSNYSHDLFNFLINSLYKLSKKNQNVFVVDLDKIFSNHGYNNCFDNRNFHFLRCRLSTEGLKILIEAIKISLESLIFPRKKVLLLDCDNTLWGGVLGEDGIKNIQLGEDGIGLAFTEFQKAIKKIKDSGIILALLSKNNEQDVKNIFKNHKSMVLKDKDITSYKVNWKEKSINIKDLSKELFLNTNSFVFWDDNPIEREKVRRNCKDVEVIEPDPEISNWSKQLLEYKNFSKHFVTTEDTKKTEQYKSRNTFIETKTNSKNELFFLKKLNIKPVIKKINNSNINRAIQMSAKTNQFNFNLKRFSQNNFSPNKKNQFTFLVHLKDDFGDHGFISLVNCIKSNDYLFIDQFLLSCRILGRYVENWIIHKIKEYAKKNKVKKIIFEYVKKEINIVTENFIKENNLKPINLNNFNTKDKNDIEKLMISKKSRLLSLNLDSKVKFLDIYGIK